VRGFPHWGLWAQRSRGFGQDVASFFLATEAGSPTLVAAHIMGSPDIFDSRPETGLPGNLSTGALRGAGES
jgi:hypothetical protein